MQITINDHSHIFAIREEFNSAFPNLKLEFFTKPLSDGPAERGYDRCISFNDCRTIYSDRQITIDPHMIVSDLEIDVRKTYGFGVVIFKKKGNNWIDTYDENNLSLEKLNKIT